MGLLAFLVISMHFLPWNAFVLPLLDPLFGHQVQTYFREGLPAHRGIHNSMGHELLLVCLIRMQMTEHTVLQHRYSGLAYSPDGEQEYHDYWEAIKIVPKERRFHWNMKKHGYKDLCKFLNISGNPNCELPGPLAKSGINVLNKEREQSWQNLIIVPIYFLFLHAVNYKIFWGLPRWIFWLMRQSCKKPL